MLARFCSLFLVYSSRKPNLRGHFQEFIIPCNAKKMANKLAVAKTSKMCVKAERNKRSLCSSRWICRDDMTLSSIFAGDHIISNKLILHCQQKIFGVHSCCCCHPKLEQLGYWSYVWEALFQLKLNRKNWRSNLTCFRCTHAIVYFKYTLKPNLFLLHRVFCSIYICINDALVKKIYI